MSTQRAGRAARTRPRVLVVGAGFAGVATARGLSREPVRVTLLDRNNYHLFTPLLYRVASAMLDPAEIARGGPARDPAGARGRRLPGGRAPVHQMRGVREIESRTRTTFWRGVYDTEPELRARFFRICGLAGG